MRRGGIGGVGGARAHQAHHRLGLRQVELAVEEGALGELAGQGWARAVREERLQDALERDGTAVAVQFQHVFARVAAWRAHQHRQTVVERRAVDGADAGAVEVVRGPGAGGMPLCDAFGERRRSRSADADDADTAAAGGGGDRGDGVGDVHRERSGGTCRAGAPARTCCGIGQDAGVRRRPGRAPAGAMIRRR